MKLTHTVVAGGHYVNIECGNVELSVRTESGTAKELREFADEQEEKANRLYRNAMLARVAGELMDIDSKARGEVTDK